MESCYIDGVCCSGARFSFCEDCKRAKRENQEEIAKAKTPVERSIAHIPKIENKFMCYWYKPKLKNFKEENQA